MIDTRGLPATIKWMENELAALKIAHERGLGLVDYYRKSFSGTSTAGALDGYITATALDGETTPFFAQLEITDWTQRWGALVSGTVTSGSITWPLYLEGYDDNGNPQSVSVSGSIISTANIKVELSYA